MKKLVFCLTILCVAAISVIILMFAGVIPCECNKSNEVTIDANKLKEINDGDYNATKLEVTQYNSFALLANGKVIIDFDREIKNIDNAVDFALLNNNLYILTNDGNVYTYYTGVTKEATLEATKVDSVKDIKKLVSYFTRRKNAGGCNYVVAVDKDSNYTKLEEMCV